MVRISLLAIGLLAVTGCSTLKPAWFPGTAPAASDSSTGPAGSQPQAAAQELKAPPEPPKLNSSELAECMHDLANGVQLEEARQYSEARKVYEQIIKKCPGRYEAYHRLGQVCDRQKRFAEAQENYQHAILLAGNAEPGIFNDLGYSFFLQGKLDKAESAIRKAVALRPTEPTYHNNLGLVYGHQKRFEDAWNEFRRAGGEAEACYNLAFIKSSLNDFEGAKACFRRALAIDPSHDRARRALRAFELAETDPDSLAQLEVCDEDGTQWVPYVENGQDQGQPQDAPPTATAGNTTSGNRSSTAAGASSPTSTSGNGRTMHGN